MLNRRTFIKSLSGLSILPFLPKLPSLSLPVLNRLTENEAFLVDIFKSIQRSDTSFKTREVGYQTRVKFNNDVFDLAVPGMHAYFKIDNQVKDIMLKDVSASWYPYDFSKPKPADSEILDHGIWVVCFSDNIKQWDKDFAMNVMATMLFLKGKYKPLGFNQYIISKKIA